MNRIRTRVDVHCIMVPAYGRTYQNKDEAIADFNANKDFLVTADRQTAYSTKREMVAFGYNCFEIYFTPRYDSGYTVVRL